jgi:hypothetical protein
MKLSEILHKIVISPKSPENYEDLKQYFYQNNQKDIANAIEHLLELRNASCNDSSSEQKQ